MSISTDPLVADTRVRTVSVTQDEPVVGLMDGRTLSVPRA
jgi:hypothetical protein